MQADSSSPHEAVPDVQLGDTDNTDLATPDEPNEEPEGLWHNVSIDPDENYSDDDDLEVATLERDETMNALLLMCEGELVELEAEGSWFEECVQRAQQYFEKESPDELDEVESLTHVCSGELMYRDDSPASDGSEEWAVEAILQHKMFKGKPYYLVRWRGYTAPSWELEDDLIDQGYSGWLEDFVHKRALESRKSSGSALLTKQQRPSYGIDVPIPPQRPGEFCPEHYWPDFKTLIVNAFRQSDSHCCVSRIQNIVNPALSHSFMKEWMGHQTKRAQVPLMVFHCTREQNIPGIITNGLVIPGTGTGVSVVNGSAYGVGIYTARNNPLLSYCVQGNYAIVCAGLVGQRYTSAKQFNQIVVFFDPRLVLPCFLVEFHIRQSCHHVPTYVADIYKAGARWPPPCPRPFTHHNQLISASQFYPASIPKVPGQHNSRWEAHARAKPISKRQLKQCARRVKALYKEGTLKQVRHKH